MLKAAIAGIAVLGGISAAAIAQDRAPTVAETIVEGMEVVDPLAFQATAAAWNTFMTSAAQLALQAAGSDEVRELSLALIEGNAGLKPGLASASEADGLPTAPVEGLDGRQSGMIGKLEAAPANDFDRLFLDMQRAAHEEAIGLFKGFAANGTGRLQAYAAETLPVLEENLRQIEVLLPPEPA